MLVRGFCTDREWLRNSELDPARNRGTREFPGCCSEILHVKLPMLKTDQMRKVSAVRLRMSKFAWGAKQITLVIVSLVVLFLAEALASAATYYVATNGSDSNPGTITQPFATLEKARDTLRSTGPGTVYVRGGTYYRNSTFSLTSQDSGTTWMAYANEMPILFGGRAITNFAVWQNNILRTDITTQGFTAHFWQFYCNGALQRLARYPNYSGVGPAGYSAVVSGSGNSFTYNPGDIRTYAHPTELQVFIFPGLNYGNDIVPVSSIDSVNHIVYLNGGTEWSITAGNRYFVQNALEELDAPGEWYLDSTNKYLYFYPSNTLTSAYAPIVSNMVTLASGTANVIFQGFTLQCCSGTGIALAGTTGCQISGNSLLNIGDYNGSGVTVSGGSGNGVTSNSIAFVGNNGISLSGGTSLTRTPANNYADNNTIHNMGVVNKACAGVYMTGVSNRASHNLIYNSPRWGIIAGQGCDMRVESNHIYSCMLETSDGAPIYIWSSFNWTDCRGSRVSGNYLHDCTAYNNGLCQGIYLDDFANGVDIVGNIVCRMSNAGIYLHAGRDNWIKNNIVYGCKNTEILYSGDTTSSSVWTAYYSSMLTGYNAAVAQPAWSGVRGMDVSPAITWPSGYTQGGNLCVTNVLYCSSSSGNPFAGTYNYLTLSSNTWDYNLVYSQSGTIYNSTYPFGSFTWPNWQAQGFDTHSITLDPLFANPAADDFRLANNSPALSLGFVQITTNTSGPYNNAVLVYRPPAPQNLRVVALTMQ